MAVTMNRIANSNGTGTSFNTGTFLSNANTLVFAFLSQQGSFTPGITLPNGNGLTWVTLFSPEVFVYGASSTAGLYRAMTSSPSAGALTITSSASIALQWDIFEFDGVDTSGSNGSGAIVQTAQNFAADTPITVTLGAPSTAANAILGCAGTNIATTFTPGTGYTTIDTGQFQAVETFMSQWITGVAQTAVDFTTGGGANIRAFGVEIKAATAAVAVGAGGTGIYRTARRPWR